MYYYYVQFLQMWALRNFWVETSINSRLKILLFFFRIHNNKEVARIVDLLDCLWFSSLYHQSNIVEGEIINIRMEPHNSHPLYKAM